MGKTLVLTEKPSVGREVAKILNCNQKGNGCFIGPRYIVVWALGHLVTLADPELYDDKYKTWKMEDLPMLPAKMDLVVMKETSKQFGVVKNLMKSPEIDNLIIATDAGREGELVARWIIKKAGWRKPIKRLWISSLTERAIKEGFNNLKPGREYEALYAAAECRAEADWLIGLNVTRALTCKYNAQLSAGRVQTPTLAMVVERENEIRQFVPKDYWSINVIATGITFRWQDKNGQTRLFDKAKADQIVDKVTGQTGEVLEVKKEAKKEFPPLAYDLTELQRDANRKYGFSAKMTSSVMQQLYENHKIVTYPRTDSRHISEDIVATLPERLKSIAQGKVVKLKGWRKVYEGPSRLDDDSEDGETEQTLPEIRKGESLKNISVKLVTDKTKPPARHTEATLLSAMEHPGKLINNQSLREVMDQSHGLGTPATRAEIIEKLFNSFYMNRQGKEIIPTSKGIQLIGLVPPELKSPELTAKWEQQLTEISKGRIQSQKFMTESEGMLLNL